MDLEIAFACKALLTSVYVKMNAHDQLLSEGACSQLGILEYHKNVWPGCDLHSTVMNQATDRDQANQETDAKQKANAGQSSQRTDADQARSSNL